MSRPIPISETSQELSWVWNLPNLLTVFRFILVPFQVALLIKGLFAWAFFAYFLAGLSDCLDGYWARRTGKATGFGAMLDPLADKVTIMATFLSLVYLQIIPLWLALLVVSRDLLIIVGVNILLWTGRRIPWHAIPIGKATTVSQYATILAAILAHFGWFPELGVRVLAGLTGLMTVWSFVVYVRLWQKIFGSGRVSGNRS